MKWTVCGVEDTGRGLVYYREIDEVSSLNNLVHQALIAGADTILIKVITDQEEENNVSK